MPTDTQNIAGITIRIVGNMIWLSKTWEWLKKNWKYVATFGVPVLISFVVSLIRKNDSLENALEMKEQEQKIDDEVAQLGERLQKQAQVTREKTIEKVLENHKETLEAIATEEEQRLTSIVDAESATQAIREKLNE